MKRIEQHETTAGDVVVGGGLAGLAAATILARNGRSVTLFEKSKRPGGRAITQVKNDYHFNLGPHALYRKGAAVRILSQLGVDFRGGVPPVTGNYTTYKGKLLPLPGGFDLLTSSLLPGRARFEVMGALAAVMLARPSTFDNISLETWLATRVKQPAARQFLELTFRIFSYINDTSRVSAGAIMAQAQLAVPGNVYYLDGGWQVLVDGLRRTAEEAGVHIITGARVVEVEVTANGMVSGVKLADGHSATAANVILSTSPAEAAGIVSGDLGIPLHDWAATAVPARVACMDLALRRLPQPNVRLALAFEAPLYFSAHSAYAKLAPDGGAVVHMMKYLPGDAPPDAAAVQQELEGLLDQAQPGWQKEVVECRYLPNLTVINGLPLAKQGGLRGRPGPAVPAISGLYVAGDWVGPEGLLADAALSSAAQASQRIIASGA